MPPDVTDLPCPGRASPVRPVAVVPVCQICPLWRRFAEMGPHVPPVAQHDGERWRCDRRDELQAAGEPGLRRWLSPPGGRWVRLFLLGFSSSRPRSIPSLAPAWQRAGAFSSPDAAAGMLWPMGCTVPAASENHCKPGTRHGITGYQ